MPLRFWLNDHDPSAHTAVAPAAFASAYGSLAAGGGATGAAGGCATGAALVGIGEGATTAAAADAAGEADGRPGVFEEEGSSHPASSRRIGTRHKSARFITVHRLDPAGGTVPGFLAFSAGH